MKNLLLLISLLLATNAWGETLDGTYLCEQETFWDGGKSVRDSSLLEIKGKTLKIRVTYGESVYKRIYEHNSSDTSLFGDHNVFIASSGYREAYGEVIMINKGNNNRGINVTKMSPVTSKERNAVSQTHCKKLN